MGVLLGEVKILIILLAQSSQQGSIMQKLEHGWSAELRGTDLGLKFSRFL
jgi:hypothetical protein